MTSKGKRIKDYILDQAKHGLITNDGRGWVIMGAVIGRDGHAYEWLCTKACIGKKPCQRADHNYGKPIDHGKVTLSEEEVVNFK